MQENNLKFAKEWIVKAQNDLKSAEILYRENGPSDSLCFHCHQVAEKMFKGFLVFKKGEFPRIHDLIQLLNLCGKTDKDFKNLVNEASFLNRYYIKTRYPSEVVVYSREECQKALKNTGKLIQFIIDKIGI